MSRKENRALPAMGPAKGQDPTTRAHDVYPCVCVCV